MASAGCRRTIRQPSLEEKEGGERMGNVKWPDARPRILGVSAEFNVSSHRLGSLPCSGRGALRREVVRQSSDRRQECGIATDQSPPSNTTGCSQTTSTKHPSSLRTV